MTAERLPCNVLSAENCCNLSLIGIACNLYPDAVAYMEIRDSSLHVALPTVC